MATGNPKSAPFRFDSPRQERVYHRLVLVGPGPAAFFRDACRLMAQEPFLEAATHVIAHLLREIESGLRDVLEPVADRSARISRGASGGEEHRAEILAVLKGLGIPETDPVAMGWLRLPGGNNEYGLHARAHRDALARPRPLNDEFREFWEEMEAVLDGVLEKFEEHYIAWHNLIDQLASKSSPDRRDVQILRTRIPNNLVAFGYFFDQLTRPEWLEPLFAEGFFKTPPELEHDADRGTVRLMAWPESRYLSRMAKSAPEQVLAIILQIPNTRNTRVHLDLVEAALAMPPELAAQLVGKARGWIEGTYGLLLPRKLGELISHLAIGGQIEAALGLTRAVLAVCPDPGPPRILDEERGIFASREPVARFDLWEYGEIFSRDIPLLVDAAQVQAFVLLSDLLEEALVLSRNPGEKGSPDDLSHAWRPAIEGHSQNVRHDVREFLVDAVRDAAESLARGDEKLVPRLISALRKRRYRVFLRLAHHLLRLFPAADPVLVKTTILNRGLFNKARSWHEYALLLRAWFKELPPEEQARILQWVEQGPDLKRYRKWHQSFFGQPATKEGVTLHVKSWQRDHLALISADLGPEWTGRFSELVAELGAPEHPEFASYISGGAFGYRSPKEPKDLASLSIDELADFLRTWEPPTDWIAPSREGLGRELTALVAKEPGRFSREATKFQDLDPTYVRSFLQGLEEVARKKERFDWVPVLSLCNWAIGQTRETPGQVRERREADPGWGWTRRTMASLLSLGLQEGASEIPFELRAPVWSVLEKLSEDPEPTEEIEAEYVRYKTDPMTIALSTARGQAMLAVVRYALWVHRNLKAQLTEDRPRAQWFVEMPELQRVLELHLDPRVDAALSIRSVYGQSLPWLIELDEAWVKQNLSKIFPRAQGDECFWASAWGSYVIAWHPYDNVFSVLKEEYRRAVVTVDEARIEWGHLPLPAARLGEHLLMLYGGGKIGLADELLQLYFSKISDQISGHVIVLIGMGLRNQQNALPRDVMDRFKAFWEWRLENAKGAGGVGVRSSELAGFGRWFVSRKFDDEWAVPQLKATLGLSGKTDVDHLVVEHLAALSAHMPLAAVECLDLIVEADKEGWSILGWRQHARTILVSALHSGDPTAVELARALINRFDARGFAEFRDVLNSQNAREAARDGSSA